MSEEELLLGRVPLALVGLSKDSGPQRLLGRAQGPANLLFWAGPHITYLFDNLILRDGGFEL